METFLNDSLEISNSLCLQVFLFLLLLLYLPRFSEGFNMRLLSHHWSDKKFICNRIKNYGERCWILCLEKIIFQGPLKSYSQLFRSKICILTLSCFKLCFSLFFKFWIKKALYKFEVCYALLTSLLSVGLTKTSINGVLNRGGMHLFSCGQLQEFLDVSIEWISHDKKVKVFIKSHFRSSSFIFLVPFWILYLKFLKQPEICFQAIIPSFFVFIKKGEVSFHSASGFGCWRWSGNRYNGKTI